MNQYRRLAAGDIVYKRAYHEIVWVTVLSNALHFDNTICVNCHRRVGFIPDRFEMSALEQDGAIMEALLNPTGDYAITPSMTSATD